MTITQPPASTNASAGTFVDSATCFAPEHLREYLGGWCDDAQAAAIETHLLACPNCERTVRELEVKPDTLLQSLQGTTVARSVPDRETSNAELVPIAAVDVARFENDREMEGSRFETNRATEAALEKAKQLMDVPHKTAADKEKAAWQPANRELGVYELLKPLGRGGMGAVYLANHRQLKKQVAIKLLPIMSAEDSDVRARFQREIRVVGRLNHPSIVAATDAGEIDGTQFLVMEYVPGLDLSRLARLLGKLPVADACELIRQVALGLSCAHADGVVHRDVKPSNLMLDETGHIRILDFGLAQLSFWDEASVDLTTVGQLMGTLDYMAPEQAEFGGNVDYRADLYALGATLFRLLCGRPPLAAAPNQSPLEKLRLLANHQPPKLDTLCPEASPGLVALVGSLLSRSPQDRPASAAHVAEQLVAFSASADLVGLLKHAQSKAAESPELLKPEKLAIFAKPSFDLPLASESQPTSSRRIGRWLLAAALPLLVVAGIFIKLETDKGQLVIESDIDNIKVQIVSNGQPVSGLTINHGTTATRLRADKYDVTIDGPSDGLTIENEQFTLKNGETVVARIRVGGGTVSTDANITSEQSVSQLLARAADGQDVLNDAGKSLSHDSIPYRSYYTILYKKGMPKLSASYLTALSQQLENKLPREWSAREINLLNSIYELIFFRRVQDDRNLSPIGKMLSEFVRLNAKQESESANPDVRKAAYSARILGELVRLIGHLPSEMLACECQDASIIAKLTLLQEMAANEADDRWITQEQVDSPV